MKFHRIDNCNGVSLLRRLWKETTGERFGSSSKVLEFSSESWTLTDLLFFMVPGRLLRGAQPRFGGCVSRDFSSAEESGGGGSTDLFA